MQDFDREESCPDCLKELYGPLVGTGFTQVHVSVPDVSAHYNQAFGKVIHNKTELEETIRIHNDEHGTDLQAVGNDRLVATVPKQKMPDMRGAYQQIRKAGWRA